MNNTRTIMRATLLVALAHWLAIHHDSTVDRLIVRLADMLPF